MKKILRLSILLVLGIVLALVLIPYVYKKYIIAIAKQNINENLNAEVDFRDLDISLIRSFPKARITFYDLKIQGVDTFDQVTLLESPSFYIETNISPIFNKSIKPSISYLSMDSPKMHIVRINDSLANYLITKPTTDTSTFSIALEGYEIKNGSLVLEDKPLVLNVLAEGINHTGSGNLSTNVYDLKTLTDAKSLTLKYDGFTYLNQVKSKLDALIKVDLLNEAYKIDNGKLKLNKLDILGSGTMDFDLDDIKVKGDFKTLGSKFGDFVSALPFISQGDDTYTAEGTADLSLNVEGIYNSLVPKYPSFSLNTKINNGQLKYSKLPYPIKDIKTDINISSTKPRLEDLKINIPQFVFGVNNEIIKGSLNIDKTLSNPMVTGNLNGIIDLNNWKKSIPLDGVETFAGRILSDIDFKGSLDDIDNKRYEKIKLDGDFKINDMVYKAKGAPSLKIHTLLIDASPRQIILDGGDINYGKSDFKISGAINDPLSVFSNKSGISGVIKLQSDLIDANELRGDQVSSSTPQASSFDLSLYETSELVSDIKIKKLLYDRHVVENLTIIGKAGLNAMKIDDLSAKINESDLKISGKVVNAFDYLMKNEKLQGELNLKSDYLNLNDFMANGSADTASGKGIIPVPAQVDIKLNTQLTKVDYTNLTFNNMSGQLTVADSEAKLENLIMGIFGGKISIDGLYGTKSITDPSYRIKLNFDKLRMEDAYQKFVTLQALAPVAQFVKGVFNTTLVMEGNMDSNMTPNFPTLNAQGFIETINSGLAQINILTELGEKIGVEQLSKINLAESRNWFEIKNGYVELKEKVLESKGIGFKISGRHQIKGPMEYLMMVKIPRSLIKNSKIGNAADKGLTWVVNEAKRKGVNIDQGEFIDFKVEIGGKLMKPTMKVTPLGSSGQSIAKEVEAEVKAAIVKTTDSLKTVIKDQKTKIEDSVRTRLEQELEAAKKKAIEEAEKRAQEAANSVKNEVKKEIEARLDSTISGAVKDTLLKKADEILKSKTGTKVDDLKKKIEDFNPFKKKKNGINK